MAFSDALRGMGDVILNNKLITFLSVALFAFVIATIALASEKNSNADALADCQGQLWHATSVATPAPTTTNVPDGSTTTVAPGETSTTVETTTTTMVPTTTESTLAPVTGGRFLVNLDHGERIRRR